MWLLSVQWRLHEIKKWQDVKDKQNPCEAAEEDSHSASSAADDVIDQPDSLLVFKFHPFVMLNALFYSSFNFLAIFWVI